MAGALGTLARYSLAGIVQRWSGVSFPWGTYSVNVIGSFLFGLIWTLASERFIISPEVRLYVLTGFMGAFTTFSTFMFETGELLRGTSLLLGLANVTVQIVSGVLAVFLGWAAGRMV